MAAQYAEWLTPRRVSSIGEIKPGSGAVLRRGLSKVAVYRDEHGKAARMSAVCPHLGCIVHWNNAESTWDCPCHGSRFDHLRQSDQRPVEQGPAASGIMRPFFSGFHP